MEDAQIIALYLDRSESAIAETAVKYGNFCQTIAYRILESREDSEECVNDAYLRLWNSIPPNLPESLPAYLGRITRNLALDKFDSLQADKRGGGQVTCTLDELHTCLSSDDRIVDELAMTELLNDFLGTLSPPVRKIFMLRYWHMLSVKEIADRQRISLSSVKMTLLRARNKLRKTLKKEGMYL